MILVLCVIVLCYMLRCEGGLMKNGENREVSDVVKESIDKL
jgi:hypothetical protein